MKKTSKKSRKASTDITSWGNIRPVRIEWIKARRKQLGLTLAEAAKRAGMSNPIQWHKVESGKFRDPRMTTILRMAKALRCKPMELVNWRQAR